MELIFINARALAYWLREHTATNDKINKRQTNNQHCNPVRPTA